jgi:hypothetical protein
VGGWEGGREGGRGYQEIKETSEEKGNPNGPLHFFDLLIPPPSLPPSFPPSLPPSLPQHLQKMDEAVAKFHSLYGTLTILGVLLSPHLNVWLGRK